MAIDSRGSAGGIAMLWNPTNIMVDFWIGLHRILIGLFRKIGTKEKILISSIYGPHILGEIKAFLNSIRMMNNMHTKKYWLLGGGYNMIMHMIEKKGGIRREEPEMQLFRDLITELKLVNIPTMNTKFTSNKRVLKFFSLCQVHHLSS